MPDNNKRKVLYDQLTQDGYDLGNYDSFSKNLDNEGNRKNLYDAITADSYDVGDYDTFSRKLDEDTEGSVSNQVVAEYDKSVADAQGKKLKPDTVPSSFGGYEAGESGAALYANRQYEKAQEQNAAAEKGERERQAADMRKYLEESGQLERLDEAGRRAQGVIDKNGGEFSLKQGLFGGILSLPSAVKYAYNRLFNPEARAAYATKEKVEEAKALMEEAGHAGKGWADKQLGGLARGFAKGLTDEGTWDFGVTGTADAYTLNDILSRQQKGEKITPSEQDLLDVSGLSAAVEDAYRDQVGMGYNVGRSLPESAGFMAQMYLNPASGLAKAAVKKYGTTTVKKVMARAAGDVAEMGIGTLTTGLGRVAEDAINRTNGQSTYDVDENGIIRYGGQADQENAVNATFKALGSNFIENYSEAMGEYFSPMGNFLGNMTKKGLRKGGLGKLVDTFDWMKSSQWSRAIQDFKDKTKFNGLVGEYMEEVAGNIMNASTVGDMNFNSPDDPRSVFNLETNIETALSCAFMSGTMMAVERFGDFGESHRLSRKVVNAEREAEKAFAGGVANPAMEWSKLREGMEKATPDGLSEMMIIIKEDADLTPEQKGAAINYGLKLLTWQAYNSRKMANKEEMTGEALAAEEAYNEGMAMPPEQHYSAEQEKTMAGEALRNADAGLFETVEGLLEDDSSFGEMENLASGLSDEQSSLVWDYYNKAKRVDGVIDAALEEAIDAGDNAANALNDAIVEDENGNRTITTALYKDGTVYVLADDGKHATILRDGKKEMVASDNLEEVQRSDADAVVDNIRNDILQEKQDELNNSLNHHPKTQEPQTGMQLWNGDVPFIVTDVSADGVVTAFPAERDAKTGQMVPKKDGLVNMTVEEAKLLQDDYYKRMSAAEKPEIAAITDESVDNTLENQAENASSPEMVESKVSETDLGNDDIIPIDEKGNVLYYQVPVEVTVADLTDGTLDNAEIDGFVSANQIEADKLLDKVKKSAPKIVTNKAKYLEDKKAWQAKVDEAKQQSDYWKEVSAFIKQQREQPGDKVAEEIMAMGEPLDGLELAAQRLAGGNLPLLYEDYKRELGFGDKEAGKMFGLFKSRENGGLTIEEAGELLMQDDLEAGTNFFDPSDANAGRNAIIDVLSSARTRGDLTEFIRKNREAMAERERSAEEEHEEMQREAWAQENFGMSYADYVTFNEVIDDIIQEKAIPEEEIREFYNTFAEELNNWNNGRVKEETEGNDRGPDSEGGESGEGVLPDKQLGDTGGVEADTPTETDVNADNEGVPAPEESVTASIEEARKTKPFAEYKSVKELTEDVDQTRTNINADDIIVDNSGKPLVLYHGTPNVEVQKIADLERGHIRAGQNESARFNGDGISFTPERTVAEEYANDGNTEGNVFESYVQLHNPYYTLGVANFTPEESKEFTDGLVAKGYDGIINYPSKQMREIGVLPNEVIVFGKGSILPVSPSDSNVSIKNKEVNPGSNKLVTDERYAELRERMRKKLGGQMNMGVDPEILAIGTGTSEDRRREPQPGTAGNQTENETLGGETQEENDTNALDVARDRLANLEQEWRDRILDYIAEHYPTQATVSAQTNSPKGIREKAAMKEDEILKRMRSQARDEINAADEKVMALSKSENAGTNTRFREAEDRKELIAVHNISENKLKEAIDLGGFPMPSIAITKADVGHTTFGDISLVFDKESINPTDRRNKVYGEDAWTPVFPSVGYKLNGDKTNDIYRRANKVGHLPLFNPTSFHPDNYERHIDGLGSESLVNHFRDNYDAKQLYLSENGNAVEEYERHEVDKFLPGQVALYEKALKEIGIERLKNDSYDTLENDVKRLIREHYNVDFDTMKPFMVKARISNTIRGAVDYAENGNKKAENDIEATKKKIDERIDQEKFEEWLEDLFADVVEKRGIRNDRDMFTPSGNSRKWEQLYDEITLDNVVNSMQKQAAKGGQGLFGASIFGAAQEEYKSIDEIRKAARERIRTMDEADYNAQRDAITDRLSAIKIPGVGNSFSDTMDMVQNIQDAVARSHTAKGIHKYLKEFYPKVTMEAANEIADIVKDIQRMSARYFEAKPYRAVGFDEVRLAVVPSNTDANLVEQLKRHGIEVRTYKRGNEGQREQVVKKATDEMNLIFREIEGVNRKFNEELSGLNEENANSVRLELGHPSNVLLSAGIPDKPLMLYGNKLLKKVQKHNFEIKDVRNLPMSLEHPIAVFDGSHSNSYAVLTEMQINGKNVLVSIETNKQGEVDFNIISSVFGKNDKGVIKWVIDGKLKYVDKGKALPYISASAPIADATYKEELSDATKIVENFENPTVIQGKITQAIEDLSSALHTPVKIARTYDDVTNGAAKRAIEQGRSVKAWFDPNTGEVVVYLPNATDVNDAVKSILHEVVGHKGLRELLGKDNFDDAMMKLYRQLPVEARNEIADVAVRKYNGNVAVAMDEYLAEQAEKDETPTWWGKVVSAIRNLLRKVGVNVELSEGDVRYLLWRSRKKLEDGDALDLAEDAMMRYKNGIGEYEQVSDSGTRFREADDVPIREKAMAREHYERVLNTAGYKMQESWQDSMLGLKEAQEAIAKATHSRIMDYENAYMAENALSSTNLAEMEAYSKLVFKPLLDEVNALIAEGAEYGDVSDYLMAKHGIERNREMAVRKALGEDEETMAENLEGWNETKQAVWDDGSLSWREKQEKLDAIAEKEFGADLSNDYSGLSAVFDEAEDWQEEAYGFVEGFEEKFKPSSLMEKVNEATDAILTKQRESGLISADTMRNIQGMYQYYVPLRGFKVTTADEVYDYLTTETSSFSAPVRTARGRRSAADDPIATIANVAESGIVQGNKNLMKQKFLTMAQNHRTDLVSVDELWVKENEVTGEWEAVFPDIPSNATPRQVEQIVEDFNKRMEELSKEEKPTVKRSRDAVNIPYKILPHNLKEHQVIVKRGGKSYVLTINGNPRAAQALNGMTNPDASDSPFLKALNAANRFMAQNFTARNPAFVVSNLFRDGIYANSTIWVKESPVYAKAYNKNWVKSVSEMAGLVRRYKNNTLDLNNPTDKMFAEFIANGGETGYTFIKSVDDYKGIIAKELKKSQGGKMSPAKAIDVLGDAMDTFGRWAEDTSRFTAYRTSREMGRSIARSVSDAKEISVNFNKKGAGAKTAGKYEKGNRLNAIQAWVSQSAKGLYIFWNAGVQGLANFGKLANANKGKFAGLVSAYYVLGSMMPVLNMVLAQALDGDDDDYYDLPEYVRRTNICLYAGGEWITIPLPIELRAVYGLGELTCGALSGKDDYTPEELGVRMAEQVSQILPIDMLEGEGGFSAFVPSYVKPLWEAYVTNKDWTGIPIYKENDFNRGMPEWTKTYSGTSPELVKLAETLNAWSGGSKYRPGRIDVNPARVEHLFESYLGGVGTTLNQAKKMVMMPADEEMRELRNVPILSRFVRSADERAGRKRIDELYYRNVERFKKIGQEYNGYRKELNNPKNSDIEFAEYTDLLNKLENSEEFQKYLLFKEDEKELKRMRDAFKESGDEELEGMMYAKKAEMNEALR